MGLSRPIKEAAESASDAVQGGKRRVDVYINGWLYDYECDECGELCESTTEYVAEQAMAVDVWRCPECGAKYYRDD